MSTTVFACIDGSAWSPAVCDAAVWSAKRMSAPLKFFHALHRDRAPGAVNLSGSIGLGARESLLSELAELDAKRNRIAREAGQEMLDAAQARAKEAGIDSESFQRHDGLVETLSEHEDQIRLLVLGKRGEEADIASEHIGSHLERVIRALHRPILITTKEFKAPERIMLAFDGSPTARKGLEMVARSPLFAGLPCHLVMVGEDNAKSRAELEPVQKILEDAGFDVPTAIIPGDVESVLSAYQSEQGIDLMIMGAYGHSRIRHLLIGSTTTAMLRKSTIPVLLLR